MIKLSPILEVYITNVCNLACRGCNRYNNYNFKGHQYWDDYADDFELWATKIDAELISIIGGEPTLNPDLEKWCSNLRRLWPNTEMMIASNGTYFRPEFDHFYDKYRVGFSITLHDINTASKIMKTWIKNAELDSFIPGFFFHQSNVIEENGYFTAYNSDKISAFNACGMKHSHTIHKGKLYKCPNVQLLPEFSKQFDLRLTKEQHDIMTSYKPLSADCTLSELQQFALDRDTPIEQCRLCPDKLEYRLAYGQDKIFNDFPHVNKVTFHNLKVYKDYLKNT